MPLFDDVVRDDTGAALYAEPKSEYLNRSARPAAQRIRDLLELWFSRYPEEQRLDLRGRFRSPDDNHHLGAFFELFLHEFLLRLDNRVEVHPQLQGHSRRPDFLVRPLVGSEYFVEAVLATGESREETAARARMDAVYDALNRMESPNFFIGMKVKGAPETSPPARQIRALLKQHLARLDPEAISRDLDAGGFEALPHWSYDHEGWHIEFFPIPKSAKARGRRGLRPIGLQFGEVHWVDDRTAIRDAVIGKAGSYGHLELPYVIAVNALADRVDRIDVMEALFGKEHFIFRAHAAGSVGPEFERAPDGAWTSPGGPPNAGVSAALIAVQLLPSSVSRSSICLYHNPWATRPYEGELNRLHRATAVDGSRMDWHEGMSLADIFELPADWPGQ